MDAGGVTDSVHVSWSGTVFNPLLLDGPYDGTTGFAGFLTGGGCTGTNCPFTLTRTSIIPATPPAPSPGIGGRANAGAGPLGTSH
jgi:hypothetical protein